MDKSKIGKIGKIRNYVNTGIEKLRQSVTTSQPKYEVDLEELTPELFQVRKTLRHGFPHEPTAIAFDPVQNLLAIGTKNGSLRILGRAEVDCHVNHEGSVEVQHIVFLINEGSLVTSCYDEKEKRAELHLWSLKKKIPSIVYSLQFQRDHISCLHIRFNTNWLYVGTTNGNVHFVEVEKFSLSSYVIHWNKAVGTRCNSHPGMVVQMADNPIEENQLLLAFEQGHLVLWNLLQKDAEERFNCNEGITSVSWHYDGKSFVCAHSTGSYSVWRLNKTDGPLSRHKSSEARCTPIHRILQTFCKNSSEPYLIFSGGVTIDRDSSMRAGTVTIKHAKNTMKFELESDVVDLLVLDSTPWRNEISDPKALAVLLNHDLILLDLESSEHARFESPYPMDLDESEVTCLQYLADCSHDLIPALYSAGSRSGNTKSGKPWPLLGGGCVNSNSSLEELVITGHADGSLRFWSASAGSLQILFKLKTVRVFERAPSTANELDPLAIKVIHLDPDSKMMVVGGKTHATLFSFSKSEAIVEIDSVEVAIVYDVNDDLDSPESEHPPNLSTQNSQSSAASDGPSKSDVTTLRVRSKPRNWPAGFQPDLACVLSVVDGEPPGAVTCVALSAVYNLMGIGTEYGLALIDITHRTCLLSIGTPDLYGSLDPYTRTPNPKSPKLKSAGPSSSSRFQFQDNPNSSSNATNDDCRSPTSDQQKTHPEVSYDDKPKAPPRLKKKKASEEKKRPPNLLLDPPNPLEGIKSSNSTPSLSRQSSEIEVVQKQPATANANLLEPNFFFPTSAKSEDELDSKPRQSFLSSITKLVRGGSLKGSYKSEKEETSDKFEKFEVTDLREDEDSCLKRSGGSTEGGAMFSRSRSSSMSSTDQIVTAESVTCMSLVDSYTRKTDTNRSASVWIGTSLGSVLVLTLSPPTGGGAGDEDVTLMPSPSGTIFRLKGALICISFYDVLTVPVCSNDNSVENSQTTPPGPTSTTSRQRIQNEGSASSKWQKAFQNIRSQNLQDIPKKGQQSVSSSRAKISPTTSQEQSNDKQLVILCSEKQARVVSLPSHQVVHKAKLTDSYVVVRANIIQIKETLCLVAYVSNGRIMILSIPSLRPLVDHDYVTPQLPEQFASTFCFSAGGHAAHMCSPSELQKVNLCSQSEQFTESLCDLYVNKEAPVERKPTLWSSLIRKPIKVDRQELFGTCTKSTSRSVALLVKGNKLSAEKGRADQATSEIQKAKMAALERGEKLSKLEENSAQMMDAARNYAENAHNLAKQMEKRKWYHL